MNNNNKYRAMSGVSVVMFIAIVFCALVHQSDAAA